MIGRRYRLFVGVALPGFMLANMTALAPVHAAACTGANNLPTTTTTLCVNGSTGVGLTYVDSNPDYVEGDFNLDLNNHDVTDGGIVFSGTVADPDGLLGDGDGIISLSNDSNVTNTTGDGINASADAAGEDISITVLDTSSVAGNADGIEVDSAAGGAVTIVTVAGTTVTGTNGTGILALSAGNMSVDVGGIVVGGNTGINAQSVTGTTKVVTRSGAQVSGIDGNGIDASSSSDGTVTVETGANSFAISINSDGILATNNLGGAVSVTTGASSVADGGDDGIDAHSNSAEVKVITGDNSRAEGFNSDGIQATSISGAITITTGAGANAIVRGAENGISARSLAGGTITVTTGKGSLVTGNLGIGIVAATTGAGTITITNNSLTTGLLAGIDAVSGTGAILITNNSTIKNSSDSDAGLALRMAGGTATIANNSGATIIGRIEADSPVVLNNNGRWLTEGTSDFDSDPNDAGDNDIVNNNGEIFAGVDAGEADVTVFANLDTLNNSGLISLSDQLLHDGSNLSDQLQISGNYAGGNGAVLAVDASLGGPGSASDILVVGSNTSGVTQVLVNNTSTGPGVFNSAGILVVDVKGTAQEGDFVLANGPIDAGLFAYDLIFNNTDQANDQFLLVTVADSEAFETLATISGSQEIWRETANTWDARQQAVRDRLSLGAVVTAVADPPLTGGPAAENGLWFSALGSWTARDSEISGFDLSYDQSIYGFVAGLDVGVDLGDDSSLLFGVLAGYVDSTLNFDASPTSIKTDGATLGVYASLLSDGFFANVLVKADLLNLNFSAPSLATDTSDDADVTSIGGRADMGYRFGAGDLFIEPTLSLDAISTRIDEFSLDGADIDAGTNESFRAGAGLRAGFAGEMARASLTGRLWNVFATDNEVTIAPEGGEFSVADDGLEGVYGEVSGQFDVDLSEGTLLFVKGGVLFSDDVTKPSVSGGFNFTW